MSDIATKEHKTAAGKVKDAMAAYAESEDLIQIGAYAAGTNERIDRAIRLNAPITEFLRQERESSSTLEETLKKLEAIAK
jgi:flagellar biosynthesis/type III secretory pathway ATPase